MQGAADVRYAVRLLLKTPAVTLVALLSLALGIGANTAIFGVINALLLRSLPVHDPQRLVKIASVDPDHPEQTGVGYRSPCSMRSRSVRPRFRAFWPGPAVE